MSFGQVMSAEIPGFPLGVMPPRQALPANVLRPGVIGPLPGPGGVMLPPIQPVGNDPAYSFLAATAWPQPSGCDPRQDPGCGGMVWPGAQPQGCLPPRPDFYDRYPGATPSGPMEPEASPWPGTSKPWPGGPLLHNGGGGYVVSSPQLPTNGRAPATTTTAAVTETPAAMAEATRGASWMWLVALGIGVYLVSRGRRG